MKSEAKINQRFSLFHKVDESKLRLWHAPYVAMFRGCVRVVDLGCGPGVFLDLIHEAGLSGVGLDIDPDMVDQAKARGHEAYVATDKNMVSYAKGVDGIHISHVIEHLWGDEMISLLTASAETLADGGVLVVRTPNWTNPNVSGGGFWDDYTHKRPYSLSQLALIFADLGLTVTSSGFEPFGWGDAYLIGRKFASIPSTLPDDRPQWCPTLLVKEKNDFSSQIRRRLRHWLQV